MSAGFSESEFEEAALAWQEAGGGQVAHGPDIARDAHGSVTPIVRVYLMKNPMARWITAKHCCNSTTYLFKVFPALPTGALKDAGRFTERVC